MAFNPRDQLAVVPVVARQSAHMIQSFRNWPRDHWRRATFCDGWTIADMVAHLATGADYHTEVLSSGLIDKPDWPWGAANLDEVRASRATVVEALLSGGPEVLLSEFETAANRLQVVLASLRANDLEKVALYPRTPIPIGQWAGMRLIELVVHDWDMRQPYQQTASLTPFAVPAVLKSLPETQVRFLSYKLPAGLQGIYAMSAGDTSWTFYIRDQQVTYEAGVPSAFTTHLQTESESLILLTLGRVSLDTLLASGTCHLTGNVDTGRRFYEVLFGPYLSASVSTSETT